jgi:hypothetical protein
MSHRLQSQSHEGGSVFFSVFGFGIPSLSVNLSLELRPSLRQGKESHHRLELARQVKSGRAVALDEF